MRDVIWIVMEPSCMLLHRLLWLMGSWFNVVKITMNEHVTKSSPHYHDQFIICDTIADKVHNIMKYALNITVNRMMNISVQRML